MAPPNNRFLGKFRGRVADNNDPLHLGRLKVSVPDVLGDEQSTWALPCLPFTGPQAGHFAVPHEGSGVWVEFEQGDPSFPVWTGCWYGADDELPPDALKELNASTTTKPVVIETIGKHKIIMSHVPDVDGIRLQAASGAYVQIDDKGVTIGNSQGAVITLIGNEVNINEGRLIVPKKR
ncbi:phage baseplate assembly protein V [Streptomyces sp. TS71-3]|uniref:phage baseplate assembly protein V n=1 Tax=Streptomyces sp. TS71-3 TaxID=2733862 RepID=UPI001AFE5623|nr:phage baseplate assembly protein V [Streptomyces sp. TS71-3]GHJ35075.1 baseplate assembly protein [Streptomyces sp. TS71-3]